MVHFKIEKSILVMDVLQYENTGIPRKILKPYSCSFSFKIDAINFWRNP